MSCLVFGALRLNSLAFACPTNVVEYVSRLRVGAQQMHRFRAKTVSAAQELLKPPRYCGRNWRSAVYALEKSSLEPGLRGQYYTFNQGCDFQDVADRTLSLGRGGCAACASLLFCLVATWLRSQAGTPKCRRLRAKAFAKVGISAPFAAPSFLASLLSLPPLVLPLWSRFVSFRFSYDVASSASSSSFGSPSFAPPLPFFSFSSARACWESRTTFRSDDACAPPHVFPCAPVAHRYGPVAYVVSRPMRNICHASKGAGSLYTSMFNGRSIALARRLVRGDSDQPLCERRRRPHRRKRSRQTLQTQISGIAPRRAAHLRQLGWVSRG